MTEIGASFCKLNSFPSHDVVTVTLNPAIDQSLVIPNFTAGKVNRVVSVHSKAGGKGVNVAGTLAGHGFKTAATGFLGVENADCFEAYFEEQQIDDFFVRVSGKTRIGLKIVDPEQQATTDINFPGLNLSDADWPKLLGCVHELTACKWFVLSGSLPPGLPVSAYRQLIIALKNAGCHVVLDTSGEAFRSGLDALPHVIKPNRHELAEFVGHPLPDQASVCQVAQTLLGKGIELVVVSMDEAGALFVTANETVYAKPPKVPVHSTVGAGDSMVAGIVAARLKGLALAQCARMATAYSLDLLTRTPDAPVSPKAVALWMDDVIIEPV